MVLIWKASFVGDAVVAKVCDGRIWPPAATTPATAEQELCLRQVYTNVVLNDGHRLQGSRRAEGYARAASTLIFHGCHIVAPSAVTPVNTARPNPNVLANG